MLLVVTRFIVASVLTVCATHSTLHMYIILGVLNQLSDQDLSTNLSNQHKYHPDTELSLNRRTMYRGKQLSTVSRCIGAHKMNIMVTASWPVQRSTVATGTEVNQAAGAQGAAVVSSEVSPRRYTFFFFSGDYTYLCLCQAESLCGELCNRSTRVAGISNQSHRA